MYNDDFIVLVDENGQPYIAHAYATDNKGSNYRQGVRSGFRAGVGSGMRAAWGSLTGRGKKYLDKVKTKTGKWRYIYDPEELKNLGKRAKRKVQDKLGVDEKARYNISRKYGKRNGESHQDFAKRMDKERKDYERSVVGRVDKARSRLGKARDTLKKYANTSLSAIKGAKNKASLRIQDVAGVDERARYNISKKYGKRNGESDQQFAKRLESERRDYERSFVGRVDKLRNRKKK